MKRFATYFICVIWASNFVDGDFCNERIRNCADTIERMQAPEFHLVKNVDKSCDELVTECAEETCFKENSITKELNEHIKNLTRICAAYKENMKITDCMKKNDNSFRMCLDVQPHVNKTSPNYLECAINERFRCVAGKIRQLCEVDPQLLGVEVERIPGCYSCAFKFLSNVWKILGSTVLIHVFWNRKCLT